MARRYSLGNILDGAIRQLDAPPASGYAPTQHAPRSAATARSGPMTDAGQGRGTTGAIDVSVVAPCYNEEKNVPELVARLLATFARKGIAGEVLLVNDGSRDRTGPVIDDLAARHPEVTAIHHPVNRGIEAAWSSGIA